MRGFLRSRRAIGVFIAVIAIHVLLGIATFGPSTSMDLTDVPVAVLDADGGQLGAELTGAEVEQIEWQTVGSRQALDEALDDKEVAAGLIIPEGATEALGDLAGEQPEPVVLELLSNRGRNPEAAQAVEQIIDGIAAGAAAEVSSETLAGVAEAGIDITPEAVHVLAEPIRVDIVAVNAPADAGDAQTPLVLVAMLWIGSLIATLVSWLSLHRKDITPTGFLGGQLVIVAVLSIVQPLSIVAVGNWLLGLDISLSWALFGALALTTALFFLLQSAVLNWLGFGGWPILVLLWLFSFTLLAVPVEALATGYRVLVHSWLPSRFPYEGIQGIVHFDGAGQAGLMMAISGAIAIGALLVLLASYVRLKDRDLGINPLQERIANAGNPDDADTDDTETDDSDASPGPQQPDPGAGRGRDSAPAGTF